jgi:soluble lytic murein transglycosylase-like protein
MRFCFILILGAGIAAQCAHAGDSVRIVKSVRADANGRLVRSTVVMPMVVRENVIAAKPVTVPAPEAEPAPVSAPNTFREAVDRIAARHNLSPQLVHSVIRVESNYNPNAVSSAGALGLMQLIPSTAKRFGVNHVFNPVENVEGGARYLRYLLDLYHNDYKLALAAYNAGEGAVAKHGGVPPYAETQNYVRQVYNRLAEAKQQQTQQQQKKAEVKTEPPKPPEFNPIVQVVEADGKVRYVSK